jgi:hypothetical protein
VAVLFVHIVWVPAPVVPATVQQMLLPGQALKSMQSVTGPPSLRPPPPLLLLLPPLPLPLLPPLEPPLPLLAPASGLPELLVEPPHAMASDVAAADASAARRIFLIGFMRAGRVHEACPA